MEGIGFIIFSVGGACLFYFLCSVLGKKILRVTGKDQENESGIFSSTIGVGTVAILLFFLGIFQLYTKTSIIVIGLLIFILCWGEIRKTIIAIKIRKEEKTKEENRFYSILKYSFIIFFIMLFFVALNPETEWDSLSFHLAVAKVYVRESAIIPIYYSYHAALPHLFDLLYVVGELWKNDVFSRVFVFLWNSTLIFALWKFGKKLFSEKVGFIAALFFMTTPVILIYFPATYIDIPVALFCLAAAWALWNWEETKDKMWLFIMTLELGFAISTKLITLPFAAACYLYVCWKMIKKREKAATIFKDVVLLGSIIFLFLLPWGIFNMYYFNNPVYPFGEGMFDGKYWNIELAEWWRQARNSYSTGQTFGGYFLIPVALTFIPNLSGPIYGLSPFYFLFIPLLLLYFHPKKEREGMYYLIFLLFVSLTGWFFMGPDMRYMLYLLPLFGILAGYGMERILDDNEIKESLKRIIKAVGIIILVSNFVLFFVIFRYDVQLWSGTISRDEYKALDTPNYWVSTWINENTPPDAKIFFMNNDRAYYLDREYITGFGIFSAYIDYPKLDNGDALYSRLKGIGVTHVLIQTENDEIILLYKGYYDEHTIGLFENLVENHLDLLYDKDGFRVYGMFTLQSSQQQ